MERLWKKFVIPMGLAAGCSRQHKHLKRPCRPLSSIGTATTGLDCQSLVLEPGPMSAMGVQPSTALIIQCRPRRSSMTARYQKPFRFGRMARLRRRRWEAPHIWTTGMSVKPQYFHRGVQDKQQTSFRVIEAPLAGLTGHCSRKAPPSSHRCFRLTVIGRRVVKRQRQSRLPRAGTADLL